MPAMLQSLCVAAKRFPLVWIWAVAATYVMCSGAMPLTCVRADTGVSCAALWLSLSVFYTIYAALMSWHLAHNHQEKQGYSVVLSALLLLCVALCGVAWVRQQQHIVLLYGSAAFTLMCVAPYLRRTAEHGHLTAFIASLNMRILVVLLVVMLPMALAGVTPDYMPPILNRSAGVAVAVVFFLCLPLIVSAVIPCDVTQEPKMSKARHVSGYYILLPLCMLIVVANPILAYVVYAAGQADIRADTAVNSLVLLLSLYLFLPLRFTGQEGKRWIKAGIFVPALALTVSAILFSAITPEHMPALIWSGLCLWLIAFKSHLPLLKIFLCGLSAVFFINGFMHMLG